MNFCMYYIQQPGPFSKCQIQAELEQSLRSYPSLITLEELISINSLTSNISLSKRLQYNNIKPHVQGAFENSYLGNWYYIVVGSLALEFLGWSWKTHVGIPMLDIGIPTSEFQCPT